jgi:anti-anti-sigma factor
VLLVGELDAATAVLGRRQLRGALEMRRGPLVLDCSSVRFIDASWLGVLVSTARYARQVGRKVTVAAALYTKGDLKMSIIGSSGQVWRTLGAPSGEWSR